MNLKFPLALIISCSLIATAQATLVLHVGHHLLAPNMAGQAIPVYVSGGDFVQGVTFNVQVEDAYPDFGVIDGPNTTDVDLLAGTIFDGNNTGENLIGVGEQLIIEGTTTASGTISAEGLLAIVMIDTTGFSAGDGPFRLLMGGTLNGDTNFQSSGGTLVPVISNGLITIIPEPATFVTAMIGIIGLCLYALRRKMRS